MLQLHTHIYIYIHQHNSCFSCTPIYTYIHQHNSCFSCTPIYTYTYINRCREAINQPQHDSLVGDRAFPVAGSRLWNSLSHVLTSAPTLAVYRNRLKTFLFSRSFTHLLMLVYRLVVQQFLLRPLL